MSADPFTDLRREMAEMGMSEAELRFEHRKIAMRLTVTATIGILRPRGQLAVRWLERLGRVVSRWGSDRDEGVLLVQCAPGVDPREVGL